MDLNRRSLIGGAGVIAALSRGEAAFAADIPPKLPVEAFAEKPAMQNLVLSPDGSHVLARIQAKGVEMLGTYNLGTREFQNFALPKGQDVRWFRWAGPDRFLVSMITRFVEETAQYLIEGRATYLLSFDLKTQTASYVGPKGGSRAIGDDVIYVDPAGAYLLLAVRQSYWADPIVLRADLIAGTSRQAMPDLQFVYEYFCDEKGVVRAARGGRSSDWFILYRHDGAATLKLLEGGDQQIFHADPFGAMTFVSGSDKAYILSDKETGRVAAYAYDFAKHEQGERIAASPTNDVSRLIFDEQTHALIGSEIIEDQPRFEWADPLLKDIQGGIDHGLPDRQNRIMSWSDDKQRFLIHSGTSNDRGRYYIFQLSNSKLSLLLEITGKLDPRMMAPMKPVRYQARDGLTIPAYLTLPVGRAPKNLPLVIMPHGGPFGVRDVLEFDLEVQFLANRGYAVLQPNYRGSDSYGADFLKAGTGEWGRKMQDDLDDGMDWLVKQGIVDPQRACLVGGSYGGYAAAWGATRNPERYRCAACFAGVFDLRKQLNYSADFLSSRIDRQYRATVRGTNDFDLDTVSPTKQAAQLKVPILLIHGDFDNTVPIDQSRNYDAALKKAGKAHEFYTIKDEGHGFMLKDSFAFYLTKLDAFLTAHNPA
jgi:dienelactone hydrolase